MGARYYEILSWFCNNDVKIWLLCSRFTIQSQRIVNQSFIPPLVEPSNPFRWELTDFPIQTFGDSVEGELMKLRAIYHKLEPWYTAYQLNAGRPISRNGIVMKIGFEPFIIWGASASCVRVPIYYELHDAITLTSYRMAAHIIIGKKKVSPNVGLEPTTPRLRVSCSTDWASRA